MIILVKKRQKAEFGYRNNKVGYLCMAPFLILFFLFTILPVLISVVLSFTDYDMLSLPHFTGFQNYSYMFLEDDVFLIALKNTMLFAVIVGPVTYIMSFMMAWLICRLRKLRDFFSLAFYA